MKRYLRGISLLTSTALITAALTGCGKSSVSTAPSSCCYDCTESAAEAPASSSGYYAFSAGKSENGAPSEGLHYYDYDFSFDEKLYNDDSYEKPEETGFFLAQTQPLSTFAADVDTASYANVRRMIESGYTLKDINAAAVREEEFLNYFSYDLKGPGAGEKFGVTTEVSACPWNTDHELLFVGIKAENEFAERMPDSNLVFLIDVSGSMDDKNKLGLLKESMLDLVDNLPGNSKISIVTYASQERLLLDGVDISHKTAITQAINRLRAGGATAGERGMEMAYEVAKENFIEGGNNRIIMATDGDLNVGISDPDELEKFIKDKKDDGIYLSVLGFGTGNYKDDRLEKLADCGNGNYSYIDSKLEGHKVLVEEMSSTLVTVAKDVKFQMEFTPSKVNAYRLIGYENRTMDAADFSDDTKDGGEIGSGHTVVALYEIVPADSKSAINLKYQAYVEPDVTADYGTLSLRYKEPFEDVSKLSEYVIGSETFTNAPSENMRFAQAAVEFAMILEDSDHKGTATLDDVSSLISSIDYLDDYKDEFRYLVKKLSKSM